MAEFERGVIIDAITRMLARREHSVAEIETKLRQKGIPESDYLPILQEFVDNNVQSNQRYAEARARSMAGRGAGPVKIRADLQQRGVDETDIDMALDEVEVDWFAQAKAVRDRKFGDAHPKDYAQRMKMMQFLKYRGFSMDHIAFAVNDN